MSANTSEHFYSSIRDVPDFPKPGILFKDITPLLMQPQLLREAVARMIEPFREDGINKVLAIESRGFILGAPAALELEAGLVIARKEGKLPWKRTRVEYDLEYGTDVIEIHADSIEAGERVLVVDDVLATGGTAAAALKVVSQSGGEVAGLTFLIELAALEGRKKLGSARIETVMTYPRSDAT